jgi:hypothetical protein
VSASSSAKLPFASNAGEHHQSRVNISWVVEINTPTTSLDVLRSAGFSHIVQRPVYPSKLKRLVASLAANQPAPHRQQSWEKPSPWLTLRPSNSHVLQVDRLTNVSTPALNPSSLQLSPKTSASLVVEGPGHTPGPFAGLYAMVVEDNLLLQQLATWTFKKLGAKVEARCDGQEAVDAVRDLGSCGRKFDLILMAILPGGSIDFISG